MQVHHPLTSEQPVTLNEQLLQRARQEKLMLHESLSGLSEITHGLSYQAARIKDLATMSDEAFAQHLRSSFVSSQSLPSEKIAHEIRLQSIDGLGLSLRRTAVQLYPHLGAIAKLLELLPDDSGRYYTHFSSAVSLVTQLDTSSQNTLDCAEQLIDHISQLQTYLSETGAKLSTHTLQSLAAEYLSVTKLEDPHYKHSRTLPSATESNVHNLDPLLVAPALQAIDFYEYLSNSPSQTVQPALHLVPGEHAHSVYKAELLIARFPPVHSVDKPRLIQALSLLVKDPSLAQQIIDTTYYHASCYQAQAVIAQEKLNLTYSQFMQLRESLSMEQLSTWAAKPRELRISPTLVRDTLLRATTSGAFNSEETEQLLKRVIACIQQLSPVEQLAFDISATDTPHWLVSEQALEQFETHLSTLRSDPDLQSKLLRYAAWKAVTSSLNQGQGPLILDSKEYALLLVYAIGSPQNQLIDKDKRLNSAFYRRMFLREQKQILPLDHPSVHIEPYRLEDARIELEFHNCVTKTRSRNDDDHTHYRLASAVPGIPRWSEVSSVIKAMLEQNPNLELLLGTYLPKHVEIAESQPKSKLRSAKERSKDLSKCLSAFDQLEQLVESFSLCDSPKTYAARAQQISSTVGQLHKAIIGATSTHVPFLSQAESIAVTKLLKPPSQFDPLAVCDYTSQCHMVLTALRNNLLCETTQQEEA